MDRIQIITGLASIVANDPKRAEFASSLLAAVSGGRATPKQQAWAERLCNEASNPKPEGVNLAGIIEAFRSAAAAAKFPKVRLTVDGVEWSLAYVRPDSERAKPENRDTVSITAGKYGEPDAKWAGRIGADGTFAPGKDATPALADALVALDPSNLDWVKRGK